MYTVSLLTEIASVYRQGVYMYTPYLCQFIPHYTEGIHCIHVCLLLVSDTSMTLVYTGVYNMYTDSIYMCHVTV